MTDEEFKSLLENETVHLGTGAPSSSVGKDLDLYVDQTTRKFYRKYFGEWNCAAEVVLGPFFTTGTMSWDQLLVDASLSAFFEIVVDGEHGDRLLKLKPPEGAQGSKLYTLTETDGTGAWKILTSDDIDGLKEELANKADKNHQHQMKDVTDLQSKLDGKANTDHTHDTGDITDLQEKLNGKADTNHQHKKADITDLNNATSTESGLMGKDDKSNLDKLVNAIEPPIILNVPSMGPKFLDLKIKVGDKEVVDTTNNSNAKWKAYLWNGDSWESHSLFASQRVESANARAATNLLCLDVHELEEFSTLKPCALQYQWLNHENKSAVTPWTPMLYPAVPEVANFPYVQDLVSGIDSSDGNNAYYWQSRDGLIFCYGHITPWDTEGYCDISFAFPLTMPTSVDLFLYSVEQKEHREQQVYAYLDSQTINVKFIYKDDVFYYLAIGH